MQIQYELALETELPPSRNIDLALAVMVVVSPDQEHTQQEIAELCGCSRHTIAYYEQRALAKLRRRFGKVFIH